MVVDPCNSNILEKSKQEDEEFKAELNYVVSLRPVWII